MESNPSTGLITLLWFKEADRSTPEIAVPIVGDAEAQVVLVAWEKVAPRWTPPHGKPPDRDSARWDWLWRGIGDAAYEAIGDDLSTATGLPRSTCWRRFLSLRLMRLVFPDGSISHWGRQIVRNTVSSVARK